MVTLRKINNFTAKEPDTCVKCGKAIVPGQEIGWLRDADRKGISTLTALPFPRSRLSRWYAYRIRPREKAIGMFGSRISRVRFSCPNIR